MDLKEYANKLLNDQAAAADLSPSDQRVLKKLRKVVTERNAAKKKLEWLATMKEQLAQTYVKCEGQISTLSEILFESRKKGEPDGP